MSSSSSSFFAVAFIFLIVLFLVWLFSKKDIASRRAVRTVCIEALWAYSAHVQMVRLTRLQTRGFPIPGEKEARTRTRPEVRLIKPYHLTSDIVYLNAETLGWDWGVHSCRPR